MDYQEAIGILGGELACVVLDTENRGYIDESEQEFADACKVAISSMQELEKYKEIENEFKKKTGCGINMLSIKYFEFVDDIAELLEYRKLGTLEEVREAVEKNRAKKPIYGHYENVGEPEYIKVTCPNGCGIQLNPVTDKHHVYEHDYCPKCGQKIDWSEKE